jgi:hypothetical protein
VGLILALTHVRNENLTMQKFDPAILQQQNSNSNFAECLGEHDVRRGCSLPHFWKFGIKQLFLSHFKSLSIYRGVEIYGTVRNGTKIKYSFLRSFKTFL